VFECGGHLQEQCPKSELHSEAVALVRTDSPATSSTFHLISQFEAASLAGTRLPSVILLAVKQSNLVSAHLIDLLVFLLKVVRMRGVARFTHAPYVVKLSVAEVEDVCVMIALCAADPLKGFELQEVPLPFAPVLLSPNGTALSAY
jgi:hypothetical protein